MKYFAIPELKIDKNFIEKDIYRRDRTWPSWVTAEGEVQDWYSLSTPSEAVCQYLVDKFSYPLDGKSIFYLKINKFSELDYHVDSNRKCTLVITLKENESIYFKENERVEKFEYKFPTIINSSGVPHKVINKNDSDRICLYACFYDEIEKLHEFYNEKKLIHP